MVKAAAELRQLDAALLQLVEAAVAHCGRAQAAAGGPAAAAAAVWLLADPGVLAAVRLAVGDAPPGGWVVLSAGWPDGGRVGRCVALCSTSSMD